jgi:propionyl-CoA carboxylase alpha chain
MKHQAFRSGNFDTHFVKHYFTPDVLKETFSDEELNIAAFMANMLQSKAKRSASATQQSGNATVSKWKLNRL